MPNNKKDRKVVYVNEETHETLRKLAAHLGLPIGRVVGELAEAKAEAENILMWGGFWKGK